MLRRGQRLGKYRIRNRLAQGGFADVYRAHDTVEGVDVALKVPLADQDPQVIEAFRREARMASRLEHPNILPLKNADEANGRFIIAYPLGEGSLADRLDKRLPLPVVLAYGEQLLMALAHAHERKVIHCDVKPDNLIVFDNETRVRLADFGLAKVAASTIAASASGTIGYIAPEQALGRPSARSDVFSAALVIFRLVTGELPEWPYDWPPPGYDRLVRNAPELGEVLQRALRVDTRRRYRDAGFRLLGISNQSGVAAGHLTEEAALACIARTNALLGVDIEAEICPHPAGRAPACYCRKPMPGIGVLFIERYQLDPARCLMVGDLDTDRGFAEAAGFRFVHADDFFSPDRAHPEVECDTPC